MPIFVGTTYGEVAVITASFSMQRENVMDFFKTQEKSHKAYLNVGSGKLLCEEATSGFPSLDP